MFKFMNLVVELVLYKERVKIPGIGMKMNESITMVKSPIDPWCLPQVMFQWILS